MSAIRERAIPGHPGYKVDSEGRVWSCWFERQPVMTEQWHLLWPRHDRKGYLHVKVGGKRCKVHRLVLEAFVGPCPPGCQTRHLDGRKTNCRLENLAWGTALENADDKRHHGTQVRGSRQGNALLTEAKVLLMRKLRREGVANADLALRFGVARPTVSQALSGNTWAHVPMADEEAGSCQTP